MFATSCSLANDLINTASEFAESSKGSLIENPTFHDFYAPSFERIEKSFGLQRNEWMKLIHFYRFLFWGSHDPIFGQLGS